MVSARKEEVLIHAFEHNPAPTAEQLLFLAQSLDLDEDTLKGWHEKHKRQEYDFVRKSSGSRTLINSGPIAAWRCKIIKCGLEANPDPSSHQVEFLTSGLRISAKQFWECQKDVTYLTAYDPSEKELKIQKRASRAIAASKHEPPIRPWEVRRANLELYHPDTSIKTSQMRSTSTAVPYMAGLDISPSPAYPPLWDPLEKPAPTPILKICVKLTPCLPVEETIHGDIDFVPSCNDDQSESDSREDNDDQDFALQDDVAANLGLEFAHHAQLMIDSFNTWKMEQAASDTDQGGSSGTSSTSPSSTSQPTNNSLSPNTQYSSTGNGKRKVSDDGGDPNDPGDDREKGRPLKKPKNDHSGKSPQVRWDCPIERRAIGKGNNGKSRGCAPNGLEFRSVWEHLRQSHYGCEICGKKLAEANADMKHMLEKAADPTKCTPNLYPGQSFDNGYGKYQELADIYNKKGKEAPSQQDKWVGGGSSFPPVS